MPEPPHASSLKPSARWPAVVLAVLIAIALAAVGWSWANDGVVRDVFGSELTPNEKLSAMRSYFEGFGPWAPIAYVLVRVVEVVVAPLPGAILYATGGLLFGGFLGGLLSLAGNTVGAGVACWMIRTLGGERLSRLVQTGSLARLQERLAHRAFWVVLLLRVNPLTSGDLVSYAAGLTRISVWQLMLATMLGMAPLCFAQSYLAAELFTAFPQLIYPLAAAGIAYIAVVAWILRKLIREPVDSTAARTSN